MKNRAAVQLGRKGGKADSEAQALARANNLKIAREKRWPKEKRMLKPA